jgi:RecG-like helicase
MPLTPDIPVSEYFRITPIQKAALKKLSVHTVEDLLYHFPVRYGDTAEARSIDSLKKGDTAVIYGKITSLKASKGFRTKITMATAYVEDETGRIQCTWFNQPYIAKMTPEGALVRIEGKVSERRPKKSASGGIGDRVSEPSSEASRNQGTDIPLQATLRKDDSASGSVVRAESIVGEETLVPNATGKLYFSNPKLELVDKLPTGVGDSLFGDTGASHNLYPVYSESRGITSLWMYHSLQKVFKSGILDQLADPIPADILEKYHLPTLKTGYKLRH